MICVCGHEKDLHKISGTALSLVEFEWCEGCCSSTLYKQHKTYHTFKLDNLSYLEEKYKEQLNESTKRQPTRNST